MVRIFLSNNDVNSGSNSEFVLVLMKLMNMAVTDSIQWACMVVYRLMPDLTSYLFLKILVIGYLQTYLTEVSGEHLYSIGNGDYEQ